MAGALRLEVREFRDLTRWRWVLMDAKGAFLADHAVRLDTVAWQYEAFADLRGYLEWHCAPDQWAEDETRIVAEVGAWIGSYVLGGAICAELIARHPATVRVVAPADAVELLYRPLELAHASGRPLAAQGVTLVMEAGASGAVAGIAPPGKQLRVLGLFSLPEDSRPLNLRRERAGLVRLVRGIAAGGRAADVRVLQYGVTRDRLREILKEAEGWDIIHVSGHGKPGSLTLETASGAPDRVNSADLAGLFGLARDRLKLVTLSACWSAAMLAGQQRRLLGLPIPDQDHDPERDQGDSPPFPSTGALAGELAGQLGCAVLAMRYPVGQDFAIALNEKLYRLLAEKGQPLARAVGMSLRELSANDRGGVAAGREPFPALSMGTPAIFGGAGADLRLAAPSRASPASYATGSLKMAGFPPEPPVFVGRTRALARASAALAIASGVPGVLLHGMPGGGKSACALELAYGHEEAFDQLVWYKAPDEGMATDGALTDFALTLERYLPGLPMADSLVASGALAAFLPRLTGLAEQRRVLIVIDNAESLLSESGAWHDDRWASVMGALTAHTGLGRVIVTSRRIPAAGLSGVLAEPVGTLSADEALLLAREMPNLSALKLGAIPGIGQTVSRRLARNAILLAKGHPKLLELAEGQAANPAHLLELVRTGNQEWRRLGGLPEGFFASDGQAPSGEDYLRVLAAWTKAVTHTLTPGERDLFWFLCCLEEPDRALPVLEANWTGLRNRLGRDGQVSELGRAVTAIATRGLASIPRGPSDTDRDVSYPVHPGIAAAGRSHASQAFRDAVDTQVAAYWESVHQGAAGQAGDENMDTELLVRSGLAAIAYLLRQRQWDRAGSLLQAAFVRDPSRANAAAMLPAIEQITGQQPRWAVALGRVLEVTEPTAAYATLRAAMADADTRGDYRTASGAAGRLLDLCRNTGRLAEALGFAEQKASYTRQAGLGPWTQLADQVYRLQVLAAMGRSDQVLDEISRLRDYMATLPATPGPDEADTTWHVREALLDTGRYAAMLAGRHADALPLIEEVAASQRDRHAPATVIARTRYNDYYPLMHLGRTEEALAVLRDCRQVFEDAGDTLMLGRVLGALADVEDSRGHGDAAIRLERDSIRYKYLAGDVEGIAIGYHNLGNRLADHARQPAPALACHLTAAFVCVLIGNADTAESVEAAATDLRGSGSGAVMPASVADLRVQADDVLGAELPASALADLIERCSPDPDTAERALGDLRARIQALAADPGEDNAAATGVRLAPLPSRLVPRDFECRASRSG